MKATAHPAQLALMGTKVKPAAEAVDMFGVVG
jgi:hypothetical protein